MRLDRFICHATGLTRSQAQRAIRASAVRVDGTVVTDPAQRIPTSARVEYQGAALASPGPIYLMLNKPVDYVCAATDRTHRSVFELIESAQRARLHVAGRLDIDATGLVLLTDDGDWSHRVMSPRHGVAKTYRVTLAEPLRAEDAALLRRGVQLKNEAQPCAPAEIETLSDTELRISITEGRYHQVKRMFAAVGNSVVALHRERIGAVVLDAALAPGASRPLTAAEVSSFGNP